MSSDTTTATATKGPVTTATATKAPRQPAPSVTMIKGGAAGLPGRYTLLSLKGEAGRNGHAFFLAYDHELNLWCYITQDGKLHPLSTDTVSGAPTPLVTWGPGSDVAAPILSKLAAIPLKGDAADSMIAEQSLARARADGAWDYIAADMRAAFVARIAAGMFGPDAVSDGARAKIAALLAPTAAEAPAEEKPPTRKAGK
jgi:hypothetical protein